MKNENNTTKTNSLLMDITKWVTKHFEEAAKKNESKFNVHSYSKAEKEQAITNLTAAGYTCKLENNENSLIVAA